MRDGRGFGLADPDEQIALLALIFEDDHTRLISAEANAIHQHFHHVLQPPCEPLGCDRFGLIVSDLYPNRNCSSGSPAAISDADRGKSASPLYDNMRSLALASESGRGMSGPSGKHAPCLAVSAQNTAGTVAVSNALRTAGKRSSVRHSIDPRRWACYRLKVISYDNQDMVRSGGWMRMA